MGIQRWSLVPFPPYPLDIPHKIPRSGITSIGPTPIKALDAIIVRFVSWIYKLFYRSRVVFNPIRVITPAMDPKDRVKMEGDLERGRTFDTPPAAMVFVIGDRRIGLSEASAQYALYNMILYAQAKGIGSRLKETGPIMLDRSRAARECLGFQKQEHILETLELGYPAVRFRNRVQGKAMGIQWNGCGPDDR